MSASTSSLRRHEAHELVELLTRVAEMCVSANRMISLELRFYVDHYNAGDLRTDAIRLANRVAQVNGLSDTTRKAAR